jgi:DNA-binding IclR family transcriptional regulator
MNEVKLVARTLDLFEVFAAEQRPLALNQLARLLDIPMSSCLALIRTLVGRGYLVEVRKRGGYYPTPRLLQLGMAIKAVDPAVEMLRGELTALRDATGETVVLGKVYDTSVLYLSVMESTKPVRYSVKPGEKRPIHANSIGKAILAELPAAARQKIFSKIEFERFTPRTVTDIAALDSQAVLAKRRGWHANIGESAPELSAVAVALNLGGELYGVSVAGPTERIDSQKNNHGALLLLLKARAEAEYGAEPEVTLRSASRGS